MKFKVGNVVVCNDLSLLHNACISPKHADIFVGKPFTIENAHPGGTCDEGIRWSEGLTMRNGYSVPMSALTLFKAAENNPTKVVWEKIGGEIYRSKTPTGWLVREQCDVFHPDGFNGNSIGWDWRVALTFVPDPEHVWLKETEQKHEFLEL